MVEADEFDFSWSRDIMDRHAHSEDLARALLTDSAEEVLATQAMAHADLSGFRRVVTFKALVPNSVEPLTTRWKFRLGDYLFNARALLDNLIWFAAHDEPSAPLTDAEENALYFPIETTEEGWRSWAGKPLAKKIRPTMLGRIHQAQPYLRPDHPTSRGMRFMHRLHRHDKHRVPLALSLRLDMQMPSPFGVEAADGGRYEYDDEWLDFDQPIRDGLPLMRRTFDRPVVAPDDRALSLTLMAAFEGVDYDLQDLMWDVQAGLLRAIDEVQSGMHVRADIFEGSVEWRRESVYALKRSLLHGTTEWEDRGFDKPSPWTDLIEEMNKPDPDLSRFLTSEPDASSRAVSIGKDHSFSSVRSEKRDVI